MNASARNCGDLVIKEAKTFDPKLAAEYETAFESGGISLLHKQLDQDIGKWKKVPVNIAVTGNSGVGKSSFINTFREVEAKSQIAAPVGVNETTMEPTKYMHPNNNSIALWDLPGIGSPTFSKETYLEKVGFESYDFFVIVTATRFTENDIWLAKNVQKLNKKIFFIRTKMNFEVENNKGDFGTSKSDTVKEVRERMTGQVIEEGFKSDMVYLIDNRFNLDYDFPILNQTMMKELPAWKQEAFALTVTTLTKDLINRKRSALRKRIFLVALYSAAGGTVPVSGLSIDVTNEIIKLEVDFYKKQFGLDDEALQKMSTALKIALAKLKGRLRTAVSTVQMATDAPIALYVSEITEKVTATVFPVLGCIVAGGISYCSTAYLLWSLLDECVADAQTINEQLTKRYTNNDLQQLV